MSEHMPDPPASDATLISKAKSGEVAAYGHLYRRYLTPIYRYLRARVGRDRDAEDLTEQVFLKAFESLETYEERGAPFSAYLYRVAYNAVVDHYRTRKNELPLEQVDSLEGESIDIEKRLVEMEQVEQIKNALDGLPEHYQEVIRLRVILDMTTSTVAEWMERTPNSVRVLLHRALKALQRALETKDE
jgi:RNA polymerase sigma-70 factor (ECF subfamily)